MVTATARACATPLLFVMASAKLSAQTIVQGSRMGELFQQTTLSPANALADPWEIAYGPDGWLWITEAKGYKVYRMHPATGAKTTVLNIAQGSTFLPTADQVFNVQFSSAQNPWPQGGCAGLALHPKFMDAVAPKNYVYLSYVHRLVSNQSSTGDGVFFTNRVVRFTYNVAANKLESPVALCDTLPGSSDHNSQRMIIAPVGGRDYLFYASGDMGAGQFGNANRAIKAQVTASYEGKILRFNLEPDGDAGASDSWIPNDNPFNGAAQSAVWSTGLRNNQGFAYHNGVLYGSSHGPFSDDELNIIERGKNYGHPRVIGYSGDGNYNNSKAGSPSGSLPLILSEAANAAAIGATYKDPIFSAYAAPQAEVHNIYLTNPSNRDWPSEGWSGMEAYDNTVIPGWKSSLVIGGLKWGRVLRFKLNASGSDVVPTAGSDTLTYFSSTNRYRDVAFAPNGQDLFIIMDKSAATSGPSAANPLIPACPGCVFKYRFIGYQNSNGRSAIPTAIPITTGVANSCTNGTTVTIDAANNAFWVPITGPDGAIMAEIKANGNNLGTITSSFYTNTGTLREDANKRLYLDRNITINPQVQPLSAVGIRLYITTAEFNALKNGVNSGGVPSGVTAIGNLAIFKNNDACGATIRGAATAITPVFAEPHGSGGYVLQATINSFSSFYFGASGLTILPIELLYFKATLQHGDVHLQWKTATERTNSRFDVERSMDGDLFKKIGSVTAAGTAGSYTFTDKEAATLSNEILYYRLKLTDENGAVAYSRVLPVRLPQRVDVLVFPNPVKDWLIIRINERQASHVQIEISDMQGRRVYAGSVPPGSNGSRLEVDVREWKPQVYIVKITGAKKAVLAMQKFTKL